MTTATRPNILFISADQWSPRAADGSGSNPELKTPAIDRLASEGVRFDNAYASWPVCAPARASWFTGCWPHNINAIGNVECDVVPRNISTLGETFKAAGYRTGFFGKDHTGKAGWRGFDEFGQVRQPSCGSMVEGSCFDSIFTRDCMDFIGQKADQPFCAVLSLINPHDIACSGSVETQPNAFHRTVARWKDEPKYLRNQPVPTLPVNWDAYPPEGMGRRAFPSYKAADWRVYLSTYYVLIENTDWLISLVLDKLDACGLADDTIVIFTADHGDMMGAHRMIQKGCMYEEAARVPFIVRWPKGLKEQGQVRDDFVSSIDIFPSFCDLAGLDIPETIEGASFAPILHDADVDWREDLMVETEDQRMIRWSDWKYICRKDGDQYREFLYNLKDDPYEMIELAWDQAYDAVIEEGRRRLAHWMEDSNGGFDRTLRERITHTILQPAQGEVL